MSETYNPAAPSVWAPYFGPERVRGVGDTVPSHRATTSSRTPGKVNRGTIHHRATQLIICPECLRPRMDLGGPHSPHFNAARVMIDCVGIEVQR